MGTSTFILVFWETSLFFVFVDYGTIKLYQWLLYLFSRVHGTILLYVFVETHSWNCKEDNAYHSRGITKVHSTQRKGTKKIHRSQKNGYVNLTSGFQNMFAANNREEVAAPPETHYVNFSNCRNSLPLPLYTSSDPLSSDRYRDKGIWKMCLLPRLY